MGLTSSLHVGRSALAVSQAALQVTGNNIANIGTEGYHRQRITFSSLASSDRVGQLFVGRGVSVNDIRRALDPALQSRLRNSTSAREEANISQSILSQIESVMGELGDNDLSSQLSAFFNTFSELANNPSIQGNRSGVVEQGQALTSFIQRYQQDLSGIRRQIDGQLVTSVNRANILMEEISNVNLAVATSELGTGQDGNLRDQRDSLIDELASLIDVTVIERESGTVDLLVGSQLLVSGTRSRGLEVNFVTVDGVAEARVQTKKDPEVMNIRSGAVGGLLAERGNTVESAIRDINELTSALIFEVNKLHSSGRPSQGLTDLRGWLEIEPADQALALNDPANGSLAALPYAPTSGSFQVVITDEDGNQSSTTVLIDLDGIDATGAAGFGDDTSLNDLVATFNAIPGLNAEITPDNRIRLFTNSGFDVSFAEDTSGVLATLGVSTFFEGTNATDIQVSADLRADPLKLAVGLSVGSNETALAIANLRDKGVDSLSGDSIASRWRKIVERNAVQTSSAATKAQSTSAVRDSLAAQNAAVSGVSLDDEAINMITYQQQYTGAARFISVVNEMTDILLALV